MDDCLGVQEGSTSRRVSPRVLVREWSRTAPEDAFDEGWAGTEQESVPAPLRSRARSSELDAEDAPLPSAATLRAEALEAELQAWDAFNARAKKAASSRGSVVLTGSAKDQQKRRSRLADEDAAASQASAYRQRLQDAIAVERAEAARLDATGSRAAAAFGDPIERQRMERLKRNALTSATMAAESAMAATKKSVPAQDAADAARKAESEWRARAEAYLNIARRETGDAASLGIRPGAAERFRQRVRDDREGK